MRKSEEQVKFELLVSSVRDAIVDSENPFRPDLQIVSDESRNAEIETYMRTFGWAFTGIGVVPNSYSSIIEKPILWDETQDD